MPAWVSEGFDEFARRMPREMPLQLIEVKAEPRTTGKTVEAMMAAEAQRLEAALPQRCRRVISTSAAMISPRSSSPGVCNNGRRAAKMSPCCCGRPGRPRAGDQGERR